MIERVDDIGRLLQYNKNSLSLSRAQVTIGSHVGQILIDYGRLWFEPYNRLSFYLQSRPFLRSNTNAVYQSIFYKIVFNNDNNKNCLSNSYNLIEGNMPQYKEEYDYISNIRNNIRIYIQYFTLKIPTLQFQPYNFAAFLLLELRNLL